MSGYSIQHATRADVPELVRLGALFIEGHPISMPVDYDYIGRFVINHLTAGQRLTAVIATDGGLAGALLAVWCWHPWAPVKVASELAWFVDPEHRGSLHSVHLITEYERWAAAMGCEIVCLSLIEAMGGERIARHYARRGYRRSGEDQWWRRIPPASISAEQA